MDNQSIHDVVIVGNGVAGIAAATRTRHLNPDCNIFVISRANASPSRHGNLVRLSDGRFGIHGLHLGREAWRQDRAITLWSGSHAVAIDTDSRRVTLANKDHVNYDRLILANGRSAQPPSIDGFGKPGSFVLYEPHDITAIREYIRCHDARTAVVVGANVVGLKAAYTLKKMGMEVIVLSNTNHILNQQLDTYSSRLVQHQLQSFGIEILTGTQAATLGQNREGRVRSLQLPDGREIPADIVLFCASVRPDVELAKAAGIATRSGVLVDDYMQTSHADVYAAGDVAEHDGVTFCRRHLAVEQGQIAAANALGGRRRYRGHMPSTLFKVTGLDLLSIGQIDSNSNGVYSIVDEQPERFRYRKLILTAGHLLGAILIGYPDDAGLIADLVRRRADLTPVISALHYGNWNALTRPELAA